MNTKPLPENAKCVFKGKLYEVWQWEQKLFDGTTTTFERIKRPDTVVIIGTVGDKIIFEEQEQSDVGFFFSLPSGRADQGDSALEEAKRELLEETGYASGDWTLWKEVLPHHKNIYKVHFFIARDCKHIQEAHPDAGEKIKVMFITFEEFFNLPNKPHFRGGAEFENLILRMQLDPKKKEEFRNMLFKNQ